MFEIIEPLTKMNTVELLDFTKMTGDVVKSMRGLPAADRLPRSTASAPAQARSSPWRPDIRIRTPAAKVAFLFNRVGLGGCDMGALRHPGAHHRPEPRRWNRHTGAAWAARRPERFGFLTRLAKSETVLAEATKLARDLADGPTFGNSMTSARSRWNGRCSVETAVEAEAVAQALCMQTGKILPARSAPSRPSRSRCSKAIDDRGRAMSLAETLTLPFFDDDHRRFAEALGRWADAMLPSLPHDDVEEVCRARVAALGEAGLPDGRGAAWSHAGLYPSLEVPRSALGSRSWRFAMGSPISPSRWRARHRLITLFGSEVKRRYLPPVRYDEQSRPSRCPSPRLASTSRRWR